MTTVLKERTHKFLDELENHPNEHLKMLLDPKIIKKYNRSKNQVILEAKG